MRWLPLVLVVLGCGSRPLISTTSDYGVGESAVDFGRVWVGFPVEHRLEILSRSRQGQSLAVTVDGPFTADRDTVELGGGDSAVLILGFAPESSGTSHGVLHVGELEITLDGEGVAPPRCDLDDGSCRRQVFDPLAGRCVEELLPDGSACGGNVCLENGRCLAGACVGTTKSCDDHNACTSDSCSPSSGCQHTDISDQCPARGDPCHAAACDPTRGCFVTAVADGTPCGDVSCVRANVCMQGVCTALTPPDGFVCEPASPCQARGVCQSQQCLRPAPQVLSPLWTYVAAGSALMIFDGVADPLGNLWWVECEMGETESCGAVSYTRDGFQRFRSPTVDGLTNSTVAQLFDEGRFIFVTSNGTVVAIDGTTGHELWRSGVLAPLHSGAPIAAALWSLELTSDGHGHVWVSTLDDQFTCGDTSAVWSLVELDAATGAIRATAPATTWGSPVADEQGNLLVTQSAWPVELTSWSSQGVQRFSLPVDGGTELVAAAAGRVVMSSNRQFSSGTGTELPSASAYGLWPGALAVGGQLIRVRSQASQPLPPVMPGAELVLFDATNPAGRLLGLVAGPGYQFTQPVMAQQDTVVVAGRLQPATASLLGITTSGGARFSCELSDLTGWDGWSIDTKVAFTGDRFAMVYQPMCRACLRAPSPVLRVFDTTGLGVASSGWVGPRGTPGRAGHPR